MSFKPQVKVLNNSDKWSENNLAFATYEEALRSAFDLMNRWYLVTDYRAVESDRPVNYRLDDEGTMHEVKP